MANAKVRDETLSVFGGATRDEWNDRLTTIVAAALRINQHNTEECKYPPAEPGALGLEPLKAACPCPTSPH
jgi:hypothetical protein